MVLESNFKCHVRDWRCRMEIQQQQLRLMKEGSEETNWNYIGEGKTMNRDNEQ